MWNHGVFSLQISQCQISMTTASFLSACHCCPCLIIALHISTQKQNSQKLYIKGTYREFGFCPCSQLFNVFFDAGLIRESRESPNVLCQINDEFWHNRWYIVPLVLVVLNWLKLYRVYIIKLRFQLKHEFVLWLPILQLWCIEFTWLRIRLLWRHTLLLFCFSCNVISTH